MGHSQRVTLLPVLLELLLFVYYCSNVCLADFLPEHRCVFDEMMGRSGRGPLPTAVVREVPQKGQGAMQAYTVAVGGEDDVGSWKPIRIVVSKEDLTRPKGGRQGACKTKGESRTNLLNEHVTCTENNILTDGKKQLYETTIIPGAVKLHAERLLVKPTTGSIQVPRSFGGSCDEFSIPSQHKASGVSDADMIIYAAAEPMSHKAAWGATCATYTDTRPSIGALNFDSEYMTDTMWSVRVAAHAMAHALGFSFQDMQRRGIVKSVENVRGKAKTWLVTGTNTVRVAKEHFKCNDIEGMELENDGGVKDEARSHWEMRNAKDELMAPTVTVGYYTELTMAVFADLGYFGVNWSMAEPMSWGKDAGCDFLQKKCKEIENVHTALPHMFCDSAGKETLRCTSDRYSVGTCTGSIVENKGTVDNKDVCPIVPSHEGRVQKSVNSTRCTDSTAVDLPGSLTGSGSWCLDAESLKAKPKNGDNAEGNFKEVNGVCAQVLCGNEGKVSVKYLGSDAWHDCSKGEFITPKSSEYFQGEDGKIRCPKYEEVCTIASNGSSLVIPKAELNKEETAPGKNEGVKAPPPPEEKDEPKPAPSDGGNGAGGDGAAGKGLSMHDAPPPSTASPPPGSGHGSAAESGVRNPGENDDTGAPAPATEAAAVPSLIPLANNSDGEEINGTARRIGKDGGATSVVLVLSLFVLLVSTTASAAMIPL